MARQGQPPSFRPRSSQAKGPGGRVADGRTVKATPATASGRR